MNTNYVNVGHMWTFAGDAKEIPEGTLCDCGMVEYKKPEYCDACGQEVHY
jgi:hypothetical protein